MTLYCRVLWVVLFFFVFFGLFFVLCLFWFCFLVFNFLCSSGFGSFGLGLWYGCFCWSFDPSRFLFFVILRFGVVVVLVCVWFGFLLLVCVLG